MNRNNRTPGDRLVDLGLAALIVAVLASSALTSCDAEDPDGLAIGRTQIEQGIELERIDRELRRIEEILEQQARRVPEVNRRGE